MFALTLVLACIFMGAFGQISLKKGMNEIGRINNLSELFNVKNLFMIFTNTHIFVGIALYALAMVLWLGALSQLDVSYIYPLLSLGYVVTAIIAFIFIKENITLLRWVGIILVVIGSYLIIRS